MKPLARVVAFQDGATEPIDFPIAPSFAIPKVCMITFLKVALNIVMENRMWINAHRRHLSLGKQPSRPAFPKLPLGFHMYVKGIYIFFSLFI